MHYAKSRTTCHATCHVTILGTSIEYSSERFFELWLKGDLELPWASIRHLVSMSNHFHIARASDKDLADRPI